VDQIVSPVLLFVCLVIGGLGVALALPRKGISPQVVGALVAGTALGLLFVVLGLRAWKADDLPNLFFYVFAPIALGSALRVVTHPKPVYAALYFILTILSSAALYLILHAEFLAFALIIIYAGAILITYLFVIMLATQAPSEEDQEALSDYDAYSREPMVATAVGVTLMVLVAFMLARGVGELQPNEAARTGELLTQLPRKVDRSLENAGVFPAVDRPALSAIADTGAGVVDVAGRTITVVVRDPVRLAEIVETNSEARAMVAGAGADAETAAARVRDLKAGDEITMGLPAGLDVTSTEGVGFALIAAHPMALELAGVILLMAMVGAVVLARKQVDLSEAEKAQMVRVLGQTERIPNPDDASAVGGGA
jgi:NADH-quinone oxidoreductase subunit J